MSDGAEEPVFEDCAFPPPYARDRQIAAGGSHTVVLREDGLIFAFGKGTSGQLGTGVLADELAPRGRAIEGVTHIAAGHATTILLDADGRAHACGRWYGGVKKNVVSIHKIALPQLIFGAGGVQIVHADAGYDHAILLDSGGRAYACGQNYHGELGLGDRYRRCRPELVRALAGVRIVQAAAGKFFTVFLDSDGRVYTCGVAFDNGCFRFLGPEVRLVPMLLELPERVVQISAGDYHAAAVGERSVYTWGLNSAGQLGHGDRAARAAPTKVAADFEGRVAQVAVGNHHTLFLTEGGRVYSCGCADSGQLGQEGREDEDCLVPAVMAALPRIARVAAGRDHSVLLSSNGDVYTCGDGDRGRLGHGDEVNCYTPELVRGL